MKQLNFWRRKLVRRAIQWVGGSFYQNPDPALHKSIFVAGTARSGTTWLGDLIAAQRPSRILFEPFNPDLVSEYRNFHYFQYMRPDVENTELSAFARRVFTGEIRNRWIDRQNERLFSEYRLIKEIRANLMLKWLADHFPDVPVIFLVRHPCAVVASRMELNWATDTDIQSFLDQPALITDHLTPYLDLMHEVQTPEEKHAMIWSVSNLVPLKQCRSGELMVVFYEKLCTQLTTELRVVFDRLGQNFIAPAGDTVGRPSQTALTTSAVVNGTDTIASWRKKLKPMQVERVLRIVEAFGLGHLYGDSVMPLGVNES